jgi:hypothetical protein
MAAMIVMIIRSHRLLKASDGRRISKGPEGFNSLEYNQDGPDFK